MNTRERIVQEEKKKCQQFHKVGSPLQFMLLITCKYAIEREVAVVKRKEIP